MFSFDGDVKVTGNSQWKDVCLPFSDMGKTLSLSSADKEPIYSFSMRQNGLATSPDTDGPFSVDFKNVRAYKSGSQWGYKSLALV